MSVILGTNSTNYLIRVAVVFGLASFRPVWFEVEGKKFLIQEVCYTWPHLDGAARIISFAVWAGKRTYELHYNTRSQIWRLWVAESACDSSRRGH